MRSRCARLCAGTRREPLAPDGEEATQPRPNRSWRLPHYGAWMPGLSPAWTVQARCLLGGASCSSDRLSGSFSSRAHVAPPLLPSTALCLCSAWRLDRHVVSASSGAFAPNMLAACFGGQRVWLTRAPPGPGPQGRGYWGFGGLKSRAGVGRASGIGPEILMGSRAVTVPSGCSCLWGRGHRDTDPPGVFPPHPRKEWARAGLPLCTGSSFLLSLHPWVRGGLQ